MHSFQCVVVCYVQMASRAPPKTVEQEGTTSTWPAAQWPETHLQRPLSGQTWGWHMHWCGGSGGFGWSWPHCASTPSLEQGSPCLQPRIEFHCIKVKRVQGRHAFQWNVWLDTQKCLCGRTRLDTQRQSPKNLDEVFQWSQQIRPVSVCLFAQPRSPQFPPALFHANCTDDTEGSLLLNHLLL
jgi:hypothetical protein